MTVASIRSNNPGAMWGKGNPIAAKWGSTKTEGLNDGLNQGNNIAHFPDMVHGAAAQFDLWRQHYVNISLKAAILKWSGGNWSQPYANFLTQHTGLAMSTIITPTVLASPAGLALMKYQAQWEAGMVYPMTTEEWEQAQKMVFNDDQSRATISTAPISAHPIIMVGSHGDDVKTLQDRLGVIATGAYTPKSETEFALKLFQVRHGLSPDGVAGDKTWTQLTQKGSA